MRDEASKSGGKEVGTNKRREGARKKGETMKEGRKEGRKEVEEGKIIGSESRICNEKGLMNGGGDKRKKRGKKQGREKRKKSLEKKEGRKERPDKK